MPDWLNSVDEAAPNPPLTVILRLILAWLAGWLVSRLARTGRSQAQDDPLPVTLILLSVLIAMATQIIGDNVARAFSLVGALSIVRFRAAVPSTRDIAYVLAAVVLGMAIGAGQFVVSSLGLIIMAAISILNPHRFAVATATGELTMQLTLGNKDSTNEVLHRICDQFQLRSIATARKGGAMSYTYRVVLRPEISPKDAVEELNRQEALESISWESNQ